MVPTPVPHVAAKSFRKKQKSRCPECGKDIHDPDCAFYEKGS
jgi:uncharacterized protein with PIN domain